MINMKEKRQNFSLRLSPSERSALEEKALAAGLTLSDYLRWSGLRKKVKAVVPTVNRHTYLELGQIGKDFRQMTQSCCLAVQRGKGCNINLELLQALNEKLDQLGLELIGINPRREEDD